MPTKKHNTLTKVTKKAKSIRIQHPNMSWRSALEKAGKEVRKKPAGSPRTSDRKKPIHHKTKKVSGVKTLSRSHTDKNKITANIQIGMASVNQIKKYQGELVHYEILIHREKENLRLAKSKVEKSVIRKKIKAHQDIARTLKANIRALKRHV